MAQSNDFLEIWERVKTNTDLTTFTQLAELVKTTHQYVSRKKKNGEFPAGWAFKIAQKYSLSTDWIMTGEGPKRLEAQGRNLAFYEELEQWAKETGQSNNIQWMRNQIESLFPMFKKWRKKKSESPDSEDDEPRLNVA